MTYELDFRNIWNGAAALTELLARAAASSAISHPLARVLIKLYLFHEITVGVVLAVGRLTRQARAHRHASDPEQRPSWPDAALSL